MSNVSSIFKKLIFSRKKSKKNYLEVDAVPINNSNDDVVSTGALISDQNSINYQNQSRNDNEIQNNNNDNFIFNNSLISEISSSSLLPQSVNYNNNSTTSLSNNDENNINSMLPLTTSTSTSSAITTNNNNFNNNTNSLALTKTEGQVIYQFSNIGGLHIGHVINVQHQQQQPSNKNYINLDKKNINNLSGSSRKITRTILKMMDSCEPIDRKMLNVISTHLGEGWKDIMRLINYTEGQIHHAYNDFHVDGLKEVIYQLLLEWTQNCENATVGKITKILWNAGQRDVVYIMKEYWKELTVNHKNDESET